MFRKICCLIAALCLSATAWGVGPREPLTFNDAGLYCGWNDYVVSKESPFNFLVVQAIIYPDGVKWVGGGEKGGGRSWGEWLKIARANGKRVIADISAVAVDADGTQQSLGDVASQANPLPVPAFIAVFDEFLATLDEDELYAITIGEEHIFWNGQMERLEEAYDLLKQRHTVPVYQWYSPSSAGSIPGGNWPNIKADGWVADEYHLVEPNMEETMRGYKILQKPVIMMHWADVHPTIPFHPDILAHQVDICRKYNIPSSFFGWGHMKGASEKQLSNFSYAIKAAEASRTAKVGEPAEADRVSWEIPTIELGFNGPDDKSPSFREDFGQRRGIRFVNEAAVTGFHQLRWDTTPLQLRPTAAGSAEASVRYQLASPFEIQSLHIKSNVQVTAGKDAAVRFDVVGEDGKSLGSTVLKNDGEVHLDVPGDRFSGRRFDVVLTFSGTAAAAGDVLAGVEFIEVSSHVTMPTDKAIGLTPANDGRVSHAASLGSMAILHTADLRNFGVYRYSTSGLHRFPGNEVMEAVQEFTSAKAIHVTQVAIIGSANEEANAARVGIGLSHDGRNIVERKWSEGVFNGELALEPGSKFAGRKFHVHLLLEGGFGVIESFRVEGVAE